MKPSWGTNTAETKLTREEANLYSLEIGPWNGKWIPEEIYPDLKPYPVDYATGIAGVFRTDRPQYTWKDSGFVAPEKENLAVYELLLRDFLETHDWRTLTDTLNYFSELRINTIELMPVNEFEGNESWWAIWKVMMKNAWCIRT